MWEEEAFAEVKAARLEYAKLQNLRVDPVTRFHKQDNREFNKKSRIQSRSAKEKI